MADFTFYGGLYRNVTFIEVENAHFDLLKDGTAGVFVTPNVAVRSMQPPMPLMDFIPMVGALPAGGMSYINAELNKIHKE